jgi:hypothetical protein
LSYSHSWDLTFSRGDASISSTTEDVTGSAEANIDETIGVDATDLEINLAIDVSALKSIFMLCSKAATIETNSGSAADDTITLAAGVPFRWTNTSPFASPFASAVDVTSIFVTAAGASGTLQIYVLQDATP